MRDRDVNNNQDDSASPASPVGQFRPDVLLLAPEENPDDANARSLTAQLIELGIPFELNSNWELPTTPPKDLSAYKVCIFPETTRDKYDKDLDAFYDAGGYITYDRYYPTAQQTSRAGFGGTAASYLYQAWGRDVYFWALANMLMEGGVRFNDPDFRRTFARRPVRGMLEEFRLNFARLADRDDPWVAWGDTTFSTFLTNHTLARRLRDETWMARFDRCLRRVCDAVPAAFDNPMKFQEVQIKGAVNNSFENMGHVLMKRGAESGNRAFIDNGVRLARHFVENAFHEDAASGRINDRRGVLLYNGEAMQGLPAIFWLGKITGERKHTNLAERFLRQICKHTHDDNGLWHHWANLETGERGAHWSRMSMWPTMILTECLEAVDPASELAEFMRTEIIRTFDAMRPLQDREHGTWHLVVDDPNTRIESTVAQHFLYAHDRGHETGVFDEKQCEVYREMANRAFIGLKRIYYKGGFAASCRGTACGVPDYYRTRPQGWSNMSMFPAALGPRV